MQQLNKAINLALQQPDVAEKLRSEGGEVLGGSTEKFDQLLRAELPRWAKSYRYAETKNPKFTTRGVLVPLDEFERCAEFVI